MKAVCAHRELTTFASFVPTTAFRILRLKNKGCKYGFVIIVSAEQKKATLTLYIYLFSVIGLGFDQ